MELWQNYTPKTTSRVRESIEWSITYNFQATDTEHARVLLIGDSICNAYHDAVRTRLDGTCSVSFWASSKCVTDPDYFRELYFVLTGMPYTVISFNNGLHSLHTDRREWAAAYDAAIRMIRDVCPDAALYLTLSTPLKDAALTEKAAELNAVVSAEAKTYGLPVIDLFTPMDALDRETFWGDTYHFKAPAIAVQADILAENVSEALRVRGKIGGTEHASTQTGPNGPIQ